MKEKLLVTGHCQKSHEKLFASRLIVDEVWMVSSLTLAYIHLRLEELFGTDNWFGGKNILFVGDILQLPPVNANPVFENINRKALISKLGCATSVNIIMEGMYYL